MDDETPTNETPQEKTRRLTESLRGLLKEEFAPSGGAEGFLRWIGGHDKGLPENDPPAH